MERERGEENVRLKYVETDSNAERQKTGRVRERKRGSEGEREDREKWM